MRLIDMLDEADGVRAASYLDLGGTAVGELVRSLVAAGHRLTVVTCHFSEFYGDARFVGPRLEIVAMAGRMRARDRLTDAYALERRRMAGALRDAGPDLVHAHWTYEFELAAQDSGLLHVTTARDAPFAVLRRARDGYRAARLGVCLLARPGIQHLSSVSPYLARSWRQQMRYGRAIEVIPNQSPADMASVVRRPSEHPVVSYIADASRWKNVAGLLRAFRLVRASIPGVELRLMGQGLGAKGMLREWAADAGLAGNVAFLGPVDRRRVSDELAGSWLYAHASLEESFGNSVLEAAVVGVPVLGGRHSGGVPFVLGYGVAGWLTDVADTTALSEAMVSLLANGPASPPSGAEEYLRRFSPGIVAGQYLTWYEQVLSRGRV